MLSKLPHFPLVEYPPPVLYNLSPYLKLFHKAPDYLSLRIFVCPCYPYLRLYQTHKFSFRSSQCVFLGYSLRIKVINICMSPLVVFRSPGMLCSTNLLFVSSLLCPLSLHTPTPSPLIPISMSLLLSIVPVLFSHTGPTIDPSPPPLPPPLHTPSPSAPPAPADESFSSSSSSGSPSPPPIRTHHTVTRTQDNTRTPKV